MTKSIVPAEARERYKERGNANHCSDWLALELDGMFKTENGFDIEAFTKILEANGVEFKGKWASFPEVQPNKGWKGQYRMNGGIQLRIRILKQGKLLLPIPGTKELGEVIPPKAWLDKMNRRYPSALNSLK